MIGAQTSCFYLLGCLQLFLPGLQSFSRKYGLRKCAKEESILGFGKTGDSKSGKSSNANPFSGSKGLQKRLNQK